MSNKKKKKTPKDLAKKKERKEEKAKLKKRGRILSAVAVTVGCVGSSFFWSKEDMTVYIALCVACGVAFGVIFDALYALYMKKK